MVLNPSDFTIENEDGLACEVIVRALPIPHYYDRERTYVKYTCPICTILGLRIGLTKDYHLRCPTCGVNLDWGGDNDE